jgi:macrolide transport system ATP-binding/permease protein
MNAELQAHIDGLIERHVAAGLSPKEARFAALREFGGVAQIAERSRDQRRSVWAEQVYQDLRYAVRSLAKSPSFTITAVLTLALGIGVNAALFSVVNMVALRPLPVKDPDRLVRIAGRDAKGRVLGRFNYAEYLAYRDGNRTLDGLLATAAVHWTCESAGDTSAELVLAGRGSARVPVELVSENYFAVLGGALQLGRTFTSEENQPGAVPVIVLSNVFWETRLRRDPNVIGATLKLDGQAVTVIGVASPEFSGQQPVPPAGWVTLSAGSKRPVHDRPDGPKVLHLIGRLKPDVTEAQAKADLDLIAGQWSVEFPTEDAKVSVQLERGLRFLPLMPNAGAARFIGFVVFSFGLVLVIACTNVANLLLARGISRQAEIGVRLMLGASRGRIVRQLLTENLLLCGLGAVLGLALAVWTLQILLPVIVSRLPVEWALEARQLAFFETTPDARVLGFTALLTVGAALTAGLFPAWHASGAGLFVVMRNGGSAFGLTPSRLRHLLVIGQVAISLTLLSCAGVLGRNLLAQRQAEVGFDAHAVFEVALRSSTVMADRGAAFRQAIEAVQDLPGVAAIAVASPAPFQFYTQTQVRPASAAPDDKGERVLASFISEGFFDTFRIPVQRGRTFRDPDLHVDSRAVMVSETLARQLWPGQEPVGQTLAVSETSWATRERPAPIGAFRECEVIGVARDIKMEVAEGRPQLVYLPFPREHSDAPVFVRPHVISAAALTEIERAANVAGVELHVGRRHSFWVEFFMLPYYALAVVSAALGGLALLMASVGLYGLMSFAVHQRVTEIGVRMALGATTREVVALFIRQGMGLVAIGLALGLIGSGLFLLALSRVLHGFVDAFDPVAFGVVTLLFGLIALFACWLPSRRVAKVDPMVALRAE